MFCHREKELQDCDMKSLQSNISIATVRKFSNLSTWESFFQKAQFLQDKNTISVWTRGQKGEKNHISVDKDIYSYSVNALQ